MKKTILNFSLLVILVSIIISCNKKDTNPEPSPEPITTTTGETPHSSTKTFTWTVSGNTFIADTIHCFSTPTQNAIRSATEFGGNGVFFDLSSMSIGTYSFSGISTNTLICNIANVTYTATSGTLNISSSDSTKVSGVFNSAISSGSLSTVLTGTFVNIKRQVF